MLQLILCQGGKDILKCFINNKLFHQTESTKFFGKCNGQGDERIFFSIDSVEGLESGDPYEAVTICFWRINH